MSRIDDFKRMAHSHDTESSKYEQQCYIDGAEDGYEYAIEKGWELIEKLCDSHNIVSIKDGKYKSRSWLEEQFRKAMEE